MIYELNPSQFESIAHMLNGERMNLEVKAVVEGYNPGWVFVDNVMTPSTAMVWSTGIKGFYFLGDTNSLEFNNSLNMYIKYIITPRVKKLDLDSFEFSGTSTEWDNKLKQLFKERDLQISKQFVYKRPQELELAEGVTELKDTYSIRKIDAKLLNEQDLDVEFVKSNVLEWWGSIKNFSKHGIGYCIMHDKQAVCSCVSSFYDGHEIESHIVTKEAYRKKGLATVAVSEFVKESHLKNLELYWDCMEKNEGSRALAEKLGYVKSFDYTLFEFSL